MNVHAVKNSRAMPRFSQEALDQVIAAVGGSKEVEDMYPLSPLQRGILFHSLYEPGSTIYFETLSFRVRGSLEVDAFRRAWQHVVERHPVLRTAFVGQDLEVPVQVVLRRAEL